MSDKNEPSIQAALDDQLGSWDHIAQSFLGLDSRTELSAKMIDGRWCIICSQSNWEQFLQIAGDAARKLGFRGADEHTGTYWLDLLRRNAIGFVPINASPLDGPAVVTIEHLRSSMDGCIEHVCTASAQFCDELLEGLPFNVRFRSLIPQFSDICPDIETFVEEHFPDPFLGFQRRQGSVLSPEACEEKAEDYGRLHREEIYADIPWNDIFSGLDAKRVRLQVLLLDRGAHEKHKVDPRKRTSDPLCLVNQAAALTSELLEGALQICCEEYTGCGNAVTKEFLAAVQEKCLLPIHEKTLAIFGYRLFCIFWDERIDEAIKLSPTSGWGPGTTPISLALRRTEVAFTEVCKTIELRLQLLEPITGTAIDQQQEQSLIDETERFNCIAGRLWKSAMDRSLEGKKGRVRGAVSDEELAGIVTKLIASGFSELRQILEGAGLKALGKYNQIHNRDVVQTLADFRTKIIGKKDGVSHSVKSAFTKRLSRVSPKK